MGAKISRVLSWNGAVSFLSTRKTEEAEEEERARERDGSNSGTLNCSWLIFFLDTCHSAKQK